MATEGLHLVCRGKDLVSYITRARVPMPKSTREYIEYCQGFQARLVALGGRPVQSSAQA